MKIKRGLVITSILLATTAGLGSVVSSTVNAQTTCTINRGRASTLTCARIYRIVQTVRLFTRGGRTLSLTPADQTVILPEERLQTLSGSRAELQFNDGSLAWTRAGTVFEFAPRQRIIQLGNGAVLVVTERGAPPIRVSTAEANIIPRGSAYVVQRNEETETTNVFALTENPDGLLTVSSSVDGEESVELEAGETVTADETGLSAVEEFDLELFYATNPLVAGLGPNQETVVSQKPASVQQTLNSVRVETLAAVDAQSAGFRRTFLRTALTGADMDLDLDVRLRDDIEEVTQDLSGRYELDDDFDRDDITGFVTFEPFDDVGSVEFEFQDGELLSIDGQAIENIRVSSFGLSGDSARGTIVLDNGEAIRIEVFGIGGNFDEDDDVLPGNLIRGTVPDR